MVDTISRIVVGCTAFNDKKLPILKKPESLKAPLIELSEIKHLGKLNVRCGKKNRDALGKLIHCNLPIQINQINSKAGRFAISLGPDEYLILAEPGSENQLEKTLNSSDISKHISVVNVSDALCAIQVSGPKVRDLLSKGCAIDLHPDNFYKSKAAQCDLALANIILVCLEENEFICICRTSFAEYILDWFIDASYEFGIFVSDGI